MFGNQVRRLSSDEQPQVQHELKERSKTVVKLKRKPHIVQTIKQRTFSQKAKSPLEEEKYHSNFSKTMKKPGIFQIQPTEMMTPSKDVVSNMLQDKSIDDHPPLPSCLVKTRQRIQSFKMKTGTEKGPIKASPKHSSTDDIKSTKGKKVRKKKTRRTETETLQSNALVITRNELEDDNPLCPLCCREQPLFFYGNEEQVNNMGVRALTPLLQQMKVKFQQKSSVLKYIKISNKWVTPCDCQMNTKKQQVRVHSYCLTARIVLDQSIYCDKCTTQYNLYIREEAICSGKLFQLIVKYSAILAAMLFFGLIFFTADAIMKIEHAQKEPKKIERSIFFNPAEIPDLPAQPKPHYYEDFSLIQSMHWNDVVHFSGVLLLIASWGFYSQFNKALQQRKKLIYVEARSKEEKITRVQSKQNLNAVVVAVNRKKNMNHLFDKFWYQKREENWEHETYHGFFVTGQGLVATTIAHTPIVIRAPVAFGRKSPSTPSSNKQLSSASILSQSTIQDLKKSSTVSILKPIIEQADSVQETIAEVQKAFTVHEESKESDDSEPKFSESREFFQNETFAEEEEKEIEPSESSATFFVETSTDKDLSVSLPSTSVQINDARKHEDLTKFPLQLISPEELTRTRSSKFKLNQFLGDKSIMSNRNKSPKSPFE